MPVCSGAGSGRPAVRHEAWPYDDQVRFPAQARLGFEPTGRMFDHEQLLRLPLPGQVLSR